MGNIIVSIVSHGHEHEIMASGLLEELEDLQIVVRENTTSIWSNPPKNIQIIYNLHQCGFGANHNKNFEMLRQKDTNWFIVCNPDILVSKDDIIALIDLAERDRESFVGPFLLDCSGEFDQNFRPWPTFFVQIFSFLGYPARSRYHTEAVESINNPDWLSGAFIAIRASTYRNLGGFDERYFMYMEDVDLSRKASTLGITRKVYSDIKIVHDVARDNRKLFSLAFRWHTVSIMKYYFKWLLKGKK